MRTTWLLLLLSCGGDKDGSDDTGSGDSDADTDSDADSDADTDTDSDADTDTGWTQDTGTLAECPDLAPSTLCQQLIFNAGGDSGDSGDSGLPTTPKGTQCFARTLIFDVAGTVTVIENRGDCGGPEAIQADWDCVGLNLVEISTPGGTVSGTWTPPTKGTGGSLDTDAWGVLDEDTCNLLKL